MFGWLEKALVFQTDVKLTCVQRGNITGHSLGREYAQPIKKPAIRIHLPAGDLSLRPGRLGLLACRAGRPEIGRAHV
jgi:hypothetical protein